MKPATARPAKLPVTPYEINYLVEMDALKEYTANGTRVSFLNTVCDGTGYQLVAPVRRGGGNPTGEDIFESHGSVDVLGRNAVQSFHGPGAEQLGARADAVD